MHGTIKKLTDCNEVKNQMDVSVGHNFYLIKSPPSFITASIHTDLLQSLAMVSLNRVPFSPLIFSAREPACCEESL
jgi:hypothetical protein